MTMFVLELSLPDRLAKDAQAAGLLTPEAVERLLSEELRRRALNDLLKVADRVRDSGIPPMSMEEINAEVKAYRAEHDND